MLQYWTKSGLLVRLRSKTLLIKIKHFMRRTASTSGL